MSPISSPLKRRLFHPREQPPLFICLVIGWTILAVYGLVRPARTWYPSMSSSVAISSVEMDMGIDMKIGPHLSKTPETSDRLVFQLQLNTADTPELCLLPRIGETLAASIVSYRQSHGSFTSAEDIQKVKGIGPKTYEKIRPHLLPVETVEP